MASTHLTIRRFNENGFSITECITHAANPNVPQIRTFHLDKPALNSLIDALNFVKFVDKNATVDIQT